MEKWANTIHTWDIIQDKLVIVRYEFLPYDAHLDRLSKFANE